jgi:hypothetical protein
VLVVVARALAHCDPTSLHALIGYDITMQRSCEISKKSKAKNSMIFMAGTPLTLLGNGGLVQANHIDFCE